MKAKLIPGLIFAVALSGGSLVFANGARGGISVPSRFGGSVGTAGSEGSTTAGQSAGATNGANVNSTPNGAANSSSTGATDNLAGATVYYGQYYDAGGGIEAPQQYGGYGSNLVSVAVEQRLARLGYYNGPIDGQLTANVQEAITAFERDNGLAVSSGISGGLLTALGISH